MRKWNNFEVFFKNLPEVAELNKLPGVVQWEDYAGDDLLRFSIEVFKEKYYFYIHHVKNTYRFFWIEKLGPHSHVRMTFFKILESDLTNEQRDFLLFNINLLVERQIIM